MLIRLFTHRFSVQKRISKRTYGGQRRVLQLVNVHNTPLRNLVRISFTRNNIFYEKQILFFHKKIFKLINAKNWSNNYFIGNFSHKFALNDATNALIIHLQKKK